jgi:hypothetical protein
MPSPRLTLVALAVAASCSLASPARATSVIAPEFDSLVSQADYIVRAEVTGVTSLWEEKNGHRCIVTRVTLDVKEVVAGTPPSPLVLEMLGGRVGDDQMIVDGAPKFQVGDEDVLFVRHNGRAFSPLVGVMHGRYPVLRDQKTGRAAMLRSNGVPLYDQSEVSLPLSELGATLLPRLRTTPPLTSSEFITRIRQSRAQAHRAP